MKYFLPFFLLSLLVVSCEKESSSITTSKQTITTDDWVVSQDYIRGQDAPYPVIENPTYLSVQEKTFPSEELVLLFKSQEGIYVFPHSQLLPETINDLIDDQPIAITYCPITGSGIGFNRILNNDTLTLTASGYLYNSNMAPLDIKSGAIWSQMLRQPLKGFAQQLDAFSLLETKWKNIEDFFPDAKVFVVPEDSLISVTDRTDDIDDQINPPTNVTLSNGDRYVGLPSGLNKTTLISYDSFGDEWSILPSALSVGSEITVIGNKKMHLILTFLKPEFKLFPINDRFPIIMRDDVGTEWDIFGHAFSGPRKGQKLKKPFSYVAYGFAWNNLFSKISVIE